MLATLARTDFLEDLDYFITCYAPGGCLIESSFEQQATFHKGSQQLLLDLHGIITIRRKQEMLKEIEIRLPPISRLLNEQGFFYQGTLGTSNNSFGYQQHLSPYQASSNHVFVGICKRLSLRCHKKGRRFASTLLQTHLQVWFEQRCLYCLKIIASH